MVFISMAFIFWFLPIFLLIYYLAPSRWKNAVLLAGSLWFYAYGETVYVFLMIASILVNYFFSLQMRRRTIRARQVLFFFALVYDFGMLFFFKYINFFIGNLNYLFTYLGLGNLQEVGCTLPLGISFYTFQIVSYVADVYLGKIKAEKSLIRLGTYICMFPQLIAGPIVSYSEVSKDLRRRKISPERIECGLKYFIWGLGMKVLLANQLSLLWKDLETIGFESISTPLAWLGAVGYSMQLYFDFNGYSLMAIGLGEMLGFTLPINFNHPYISKSVTEFWHRWHITLGRWFREYVYIPLGGSWHGTKKTIRNLLIVWTLTGLWHGAAWNFVLWGGLLFVFLALEKLWLKKYLDRFPAIGHIYLLFFIPVTWVVFAITDFRELGIYLTRLFPFLPAIQEGNVNPADIFLTWKKYGGLCSIGILFCLPLSEKIFHFCEKTKIGTALFLLIFWYSAYKLSIGINNPFMYFRF